MSKVYEIITERIDEQLAKGDIPWRKTWSATGVPRNLISNKSYQGINILLLGLRPYASTYWLTYNQAKNIKAKLLPNQKTTMITFWRFLDKVNEDGAKSKVPLLRYYRVFNVEQFETIDLPAYATDDHSDSFEPINAAEAMVAGYTDSPPVSHGGDRAFYSTRDDRVGIPTKESFDKPDDYYATIFHELGHSTGHPSRLSRLELDGNIPPFGSEDYSKEELIAEFTAAFLSAECRLDPSTIENSAAYIQGWRKQLKEDPSLLIQAAGKASKAANWIRGIHNFKTEKAA